MSGERSVQAWMTRHPVLCLGVVVFAWAVVVGFACRGCAVVKGSDGESYLSFGMGVGKTDDPATPKTAGEAAATAAAQAVKTVAPFLPPPFDMAAPAVSGALLAWGASVRARRAADAAFDEGVSRSSGVVPAPVALSTVAPVAAKRGKA